jgi:alcohol dehydrogenase
MGLAKAGVAAKVASLLAQQDINSTLFDGAKPNPTVSNVERS